MVQIGSWGTPELGITEGIASLLGRPQNNLVPDSFQRAAGAALGGVSPLTNYNPLFNPPAKTSVLGADSTYNPQQSTSQKPAGPPAPTNTSGGGGITHQQAMDQGLDWNKLIASGQALIQNPQPVFDEIENAFRERMGRLDNIAGIFKGAMPGQIADIESQFGAQVATAEAGKKEGLRTIEGAESEASENRINAQSDARRLYNDLIAGLNQRFGGLSSAGQFASEQAATELQRQHGNINRTFQMAKSKIDGMRMSLNDKYSALLTQLQANRDSAINGIRQNFNNQLLQIESMKGEAEDMRSQRRLGALQDYRNQVFQVNSAIMNFKMQLDAEMKQGMSLIDESNNFFTQLGMSASQQAGQVPNQSNLELPYQSAQDAALPGMTGQINPNREEDVLSASRNAFASLS